MQAEHAGTRTAPAAPATFRGGAQRRYARRRGLLSASHSRYLSSNMFPLVLPHPEAIRRSALRRTRPALPTPCHLRTMPPTVALFPRLPPLMMVALIVWLLYWPWPERYIGL